MDNRDKLRVLIPHWIEHNQEHAEEFLTYLDSAGEAQLELKTAAERIAQANLALSHALEKLGGPLDFHMPHEHNQDDQHHEHHHHDHEHEHEHHHEHPHEHHT